MSIINALALATGQFQDPSQQVRTVPVMRAPQTVRSPVLARLARFSDLPGVEVTFYEVSGHDIPEIHRSLAKEAPKDPKTNQPIPAISSWSVSAAMKSATSGKRCTITAAALHFRATATLPRLIVDKDVPPKVIGIWNRYVAELEARQANQLRFAYERLGTVERSLAGIRCEKASAAAEAALARTKSQQLQVQEREKKAMPQLSDADS